MKFNPTPLSGAFTIQIEPRGDERGFFARVFCENEFRGAGLAERFVQVNSSLSAKRGTLRGMHYQLEPKSETKIVKCIRGAVWDAILDLRPDSPTFGSWFGAELNERNRMMMYVPKGFAHAVLTLADNTEVLYLVTEFYAPDQERGIRWDDPRFKISWPIEPSEISYKDGKWPDFNTLFHGVEQFRGM
jgi:dTDP-4-dehydrorhamnose 3,5-epimerase